MAGPYAKLKPPLRQTRLNRRSKLAPGLVLGLPFAEGSGTVTHDFSGYGNNGTLNGGVTWAQGPFGSCLEFDGSTGYVNCGNSNTLSPPAITMICWVNLTSLANSYTTIMSRNFGGFYLQSFVKSTGKVAMYVYANGTVSYDGTGIFTLSPGAWYQLALTYDSQQGLVGYVNGQVDGTAAANGNLITVSGSGAYTTLGTDLVNSGRYLDGYLDAPAIYPFALSATKVAALYADSFQMYRPVPRARFGQAAAVVMPFSPNPDVTC